MTGFTCGRLRLLVVACVAFAALAVVAPATAAKPPKPALAFTPCGLTPVAVTTECATADLPLDYDRPNEKKGRVQIAVARVPAADQAHRLGVLFFNFGGPGGTAVDYLQFVGASGLWHALNQRFDIIAFDPRGVGQSTPSIDCKANQETMGIYSEPFPTPFNARPRRAGREGQGVHQVPAEQRRHPAHVSTANVARDFDRSARLGEKKLNYFGFSYGTFLGATYASLFPKHYRAMVLDGPVDADALHQQADGSDLADAVRGLRAGAGPLLAGLRGGPGGVRRLRRRRSLGGLRRAGRPGQRRPRSRPTATRPIRVRSRATTSTARRSSEIYAKAVLAASSRRRWRPPQPATARSSAQLVDELLRPQPTTAPSTRARPLLHDRRDRAEATRRTSTSTSTAATRSWDMFPHFCSTTATSS